MLSRLLSGFFTGPGYNPLTALRAPIVSQPREKDKQPVTSALSPQAARAASDLAGCRLALPPIQFARGGERRASQRTLLYHGDGQV